MILKFSDMHKKYLPNTGDFSDGEKKKMRMGKAIFFHTFLIKL